MPIGSGLSAQFGIKVGESAVGTYTAPDRFYEVIDMDGDAEPTYLESAGLRAGARFKRAAQTGISRQTATGSATLPMTFKNMGILWKWLIGSTATATIIGAGPAYKQVHIPGLLTGISATIQEGKPDAAAVVQPFSFNGSKATDWEVAIADGEETQLKFSWDAWNAVTTQTLAAASFVATNPVWKFQHSTGLTIGGTPALTGGEIVVTGGAAVSTAMHSFSVKGTNSYKTDRYGLGNAGTKLEQIENDFVDITGEFSGELNISQLRTPFAAGTQTSLVILNEGPIIAGSDKYTLRITLPGVYLTEYSSSVSGPDMVECSGTFKVYDPEITGVSPIEVKIVSTDTTV